MIFGIRRMEGMQLIVSIKLIEIENFSGWDIFLLILFGFTIDIGKRGFYFGRF